MVEEQEASMFGASIGGGMIGDKIRKGSCFKIMKAFLDDLDF